MDQSGFSSDAIQVSWPSTTFLQRTIEVQRHFPFKEIGSRIY